LFIGLSFDFLVYTYPNFFADFGSLLPVSLILLPRQHESADLSTQSHLARSKGIPIGAAIP
jgi:hypothetical protein